MVDDNATVLTGSPLSGLLGIWRDLRHAARILRLSPVFTMVAIVSLALGIGANAAIFQLLDALRLRTLPVRSPENLVELRIGDMTHARGASVRDNALTNPLWEEIRRRQQVFSEMFAWADEPFTISPGKEAHVATGLWVSGDFFEVLGIRPVLGRVFTAADDQRGCGFSSAVISYGFWQREFGGSLSAIGQKIQLDPEKSVAVLGVTPPGFFGLEVGRQFDFALPICAANTMNAASRLDSGTIWWLTVMGRLKPGISLAQADSHFQVISRGIFETTLPPNYPPVSIGPYREMKLHAISASGGISHLREQYSTALGFLLGIASLVLLIACANLANLMLARGAARSREIAVRLAIGASRAHLIRQLLIEGLLLAFGGAVAALLLAGAMSRFLVSFLGSGDNSVFLDLRPDWHIFSYVALLALSTCVLFSLAPAFRTTRTQPSDVLKSGSRGTTAGRERFGLRRTLVASQIAFSLVLIAGALMFSRSLRNLTTLDPGFHEDGILMANVNYGYLNLPPAGLAVTRRDLVEHIRSIPGVEAAAETSTVPLNGNAWTNMMWLEGSEPERAREISRNMVGAGYFRAIGTPLLAGREFEGRDTNSSQNVAVVSETFARTFSMGLNPVGKRFWIEKTPFAPQTLCEIVGLAKDSKYRDLRQDFVPVAYFPMAQFPQYLPGGLILIRSHARPDALTPLVRHAIAEVNPDILYSFSVFKTQIEHSLLRERMMAMLSGLFGGLAVLLAVIGLYGVISYMVAQRRNEIGIRIALGATRRNIIGLILRETGMLLGVGLGAGILGSLAVDRAAESLLFGLRSDDPLTLGSAVVLLAIVALGASYVPALRASTVDPAIALRQE